MVFISWWKSIGGKLKGSKANEFSETLPDAIGGEKRGKLGIAPYTGNYGHSPKLSIYPGIRVSGLPSHSLSCCPIL
jgi:hypothetical protein